jgi:hypothetical protein
MIQLQKKEYDTLIFGALETKKSNILRLHKSCLNVFKSHLQNIEETEVGIEHLNSRLQYNLKRADTPHLVVNGRCHMSQYCPVTYKFFKKSIPDKFDSYVSVSATIYDSHDHSKGRTDKPPQVRGIAREALAKKVMIKHGGSCHEARLTDLAQNGLFLYKYNISILINMLFKVKPQQSMHIDHVKASYE